MKVRLANQADLDELARIWHDGWHDAHAQLVSDEMSRVRTPDNFQQRVAEAYPAMWVIGEVGTPLGFYILEADELDHLYVCERARGTGIAAELIRDAELRVSRSGFNAAWLACAIGNNRAARFYEKHGWRRTGNIVIDVDTPAGLMPLEVWRYEKLLPQPARAAPSQ